MEAAIAYAEIDRKELLFDFPVLLVETTNSVSWLRTAVCNKTWERYKGCYELVLTVPCVASATFYTNNQHASAFYLYNDIFAVTIYYSPGYS